MANRNYIIDGFRGVSIIMVAGIHYFDLFNYIYRNIDKSGGHIKNIFGHGYYGVTIFFVISGYLITLSNVQKDINGSLFVPSSKFYSKRLTKIVPLLTVVVLCSSFIIYSAGVIDWKPYVYVYQVGSAGYGIGFWSAIAFFYFNWLEIIWVPYNDGWFGLQWNILWSLAVEEQFYLVFPWMIAAMKTRTNVRYLALILVASALALRATLIVNGASTTVIYCNSICCFDAIFVGVLIGLSRPPKQKTSMIIFAFGLLILVSCYLLPYYVLAGAPVLGMVVAAGLIIHSSRAFEIARPPLIFKPLCELGSLS